MSNFKKKFNFSGNVYNLEDDNVMEDQIPSVDDLDSNLYSELEENDK